MKLYKYQPVTFEFLLELDGTKECLLMQDFITHKKPLPAKECKVCCFNEDTKQWELKDDNRGRTIYHFATGINTVCRAIAIPENHTDIVPEAANMVFDGKKWVYDTEKIASIVRAKRDALLADSDIDLARVLEVDGDKSGIVKYRDGLRNITKQKGFPVDVVFPALK